MAHIYTKGEMAHATNPSIKSHMLTNRVEKYPSTWTEREIANTSNHTKILHTLTKVEKARALIKKEIRFMEIARGE